MTQSKYTYFEKTTCTSESNFGGPSARQREPPQYHRAQNAFGYEASAAGTRAMGMFQKHNRFFKFRAACRKIGLVFCVAHSITEFQGLSLAAETLPSAQFFDMFAASAVVKRRKYW